MKVTLGGELNVTLGGELKVTLGGELNVTLGGELKLDGQEGQQENQSLWIVCPGL